MEKDEARAAKRLAVGSNKQDIRVVPARQLKRALLSTLISMGAVKPDQVALSENACIIKIDTTATSREEILLTIPTTKQKLEKVVENLRSRSIFTGSFLGLQSSENSESLLSLDDYEALEVGKTYSVCLCHRNCTVEQLLQLIDEKRGEIRQHGSIVDPQHDELFSRLNKLLTYSSNGIEGIQLHILLIHSTGNTMTLDEVTRLIDRSLQLHHREAPKKRLREAVSPIVREAGIYGKTEDEPIETINHYHAVELLRQAIREEIPIDEAFILELHRVLTQE